MEFYDKFLEVTNNLRATGKPVIFCGDLNTAHKEIDLARPRSDDVIIFIGEEPWYRIDLYTEAFFKAAKREGKLT